MPTVYSKPIVPEGSAVFHPSTDDVQTSTRFDHISTRELWMHFFKLVKEKHPRGPAVISRELEGTFRKLVRRARTRKDDQMNLETCIAQFSQIWRDFEESEIGQTETLHDHEDFDDQMTLTEDTDLPDSVDNLSVSDFADAEMTEVSEQPLQMVLYPGVKRPREDEGNQHFEGPPVSRRKLLTDDDTNRYELKHLDSNDGVELMHLDIVPGENDEGNAENSPEAMLGADEKDFLARMYSFRFGMNMGMNVNFWASFGW